MFWELWVVYLDDEILIFIVMVFGVGVFEKWLGFDYRVFMVGLCFYKREF